MQRIIILVIGLAIVGILLWAFLALARRMFRPRPAPIQRQTSKPARGSSLRGIVFKRQPSPRSAFQERVIAHAPDDGLRAWLDSLGPTQAQELEELLAVCCIGLGFELDWLLEGRFAHVPDREHLVTALLLMYCRCCWQAALVQDDLDAVRALMEIAQAPFTKAHTAISQQLFAAMLSQRLTPSFPAELMLAPERERQDFMTAAMRQACIAPAHDLIVLFKTLTRPDASTKGIFKVFLR